MLSNWRKKGSWMSWKGEGCWKGIFQLMFTAPACTRSPLFLHALIVPPLYLITPRGLNALPLPLPKTLVIARDMTFCRLFRASLDVFWGVGKQVYDHEIVFWGFTSTYESIYFFPFAVGERWRRGSVWKVRKVSVSVKTVVHANIEKQINDSPLISARGKYCIRK